jgi:hypothetical protein
MQETVVITWRITLLYFCQENHIIVNFSVNSRCFVQSRFPLLRLYLNQYSKKKANFLTYLKLALYLSSLRDKCFEQFNI